MRPLVLLLLLAAPASAYEGGKTGAGFALGMPFGGTVKHWIDREQAVQAHLGAFDGDFVFSADYLVHIDEMIPRKQAGRLPVYLGLGMRVRDADRDFVGMRFVAGAGVFTKKKTYEIFFEIAPVLRLAPSTDGTIDGAFGVRRYF
jgi:hypothetical protein